MARIPSWFCARELGRLTGRYSDEHCIRKLDPGQHRPVQLLRYGQYWKQSWSANPGHILLAHHHIAENRNLRNWLPYEVVAVLRVGRMCCQVGIRRICCIGRVSLGYGCGICRW